MRTNIITIVERAILQLEKTLTPSANELLVKLEEFVDLIRIKTRASVREKDVNLEKKLQAYRSEKAKRKQKLIKFSTDFQAEIEFMDDIVGQNCALIIQQQQSHNKFMTRERTIADYKMSRKQKELTQKRERTYEIQIWKLNTELEKVRTKNFCDEHEQRNIWNNEREVFNGVLLKYDTKMFALQDELEIVRKIQNAESEELRNFKEAYAIQENPYNELMAQKEEYLEQQRQQKLYEIRLRIAKRIIVKFIEDHYPAWKKKKLKASKRKGKYKFNVDKKK